MPNYKRMYVEGGVYFFTVNLLKRGENDLLVREIDSLKRAIRKVKRKYPFKIHAWVVLPDHMHFMIELPHGDSDFSTRIRLMKSFFSKGVIDFGSSNNSRHIRKEKSIWQRRFWEHLIRDERDFNHHLDYIHFNPVKHGYVSHPSDWLYSTYKRYNIASKDRSITLET